MSPLGRFSARHLTITLLACGAAAIASIVLALSIGVARIDLLHVLRDLLHGVRSGESLLLLQARLPRVLLAACVGAALGGSGAALQGLLRNPLVDPYILGTSGGAAIGVSIALFFTTAALPRTLGAFFGGIASTALVYLLARGVDGARVTTLLLVGVVFNAFAAAAVMVLKVVVEAAKAQEVLLWFMGSIGYPEPRALGILALVVAIALTLLTLASPALNAMALGEEAAEALGIDTQRTLILVFFASALAVGASVSLAGLVGFVGLIVPHLLRAIAGPDQRALVPGSALLGAAFVVLCDLLAQMTFLYLGSEPPVGAITALLGGPFFLLLLRSRARP